MTATNYPGRPVPLQPTRPLEAAPARRPGVATVLRENPVPLGLALFATAVIVGFYIYFASQGLTTIYGDGITKLSNARRVVDNPLGTFSFAQLGTVWLPMQSLLALTLVWIDPLYYSGFAGSLYSMLAFVGTVLVVYATVVQLTGSRLGGVVGGCTVALCLNVIYLATTPMTESLIIFIQAATVWALLRLEVKPNDFARLVLAAFVMMVASFVRYEVWYSMAVAGPVTGLALWLRGVRWGEWLGRLIALFLPPAFVMFFWTVGWQWPITGNPLHFAVSEYSARAIDVIGANNLDAVGNILVTLREYGGAVRWNIPDASLAIAALGLAVYLVRLALRRETRITPLIALAVPAFFIMSLFLGQNAIVIRHGTLDSVNPRYGATVIFVVGIYAGYLVGVLMALRRPSWLRPLARVAVAGLAATIVAVSVNTWRDPLEIAMFKDFAAQFFNESQREYTDWLREHYQGGKIMMESFGRNTGVQFASRLPLREFVSESSYTLWGDALTDPAFTARYVAVRHGDRLDRSIVQHPVFQRNYRVLFQNDYGRIYERNSGPRPVRAPLG